MTDKDITYAARQICSEQVVKADNDDWTHYLSGRYDHTVLMRLVEQGIRRGLEWQTMVKTQHCPNCEATEQKLHNFRQEVSDKCWKIIDYYAITSPIAAILYSLVIPKPKPDPLVQVLTDTFGASFDADELRAALDAAGLEIREKGR